MSPFSIQLALQVPGKQGYWELGAAQDGDGKILKAVWTKPAGMSGNEDVFTANCEAIPNGLRYDLTLPCDRFGITEADLSQGIRFNLIVNDNDGTLRKGFVRIAPGIGETKDPSFFPVVCSPTK